ncbi:MAG: hypothetical protein NZ853_10420 [Leptospiraceae bacterium]|nr:hypothetical protein [Leptospiraceae bacterium]MDW7974930.1 hypothetical protein [Leptospiraceae bacterium]
MIKFFLFFLIIFLLSCLTPKVYRNFREYRPPEEIAVVEFEGYLLKLQQEDQYSDFLFLLEGKYLIEFMDRKNFFKGAALCELKKNHYYTIQIVEKIDFEKYQKSVYRGICKPIPRRKEFLFSKEFFEKSISNE